MRARARTDELLLEPRLCGVDGLHHRRVEEEVVRVARVGVVERERGAVELDGALEDGGVGEELVAELDDGALDDRVDDAEDGLAVDGALVRRVEERLLRVRRRGQTRSAGMKLCWSMSL